MKSVEYLLSRLPIKDIKTENLDSLSYHLWYLGYTYTFNPSSGATNSIMNSSTIDIISNDELRQLLVGWNVALLDYQEEEVLPQNDLVNILSNTGELDKIVATIDKIIELSETKN